TQPPPEDKKQPKPSFQFGTPVSTPSSSAGLNNAGSTNAAPAASEAPKFSGFKFGGKTVQPSNTKNTESSEKTPTKRKAADEEQSAKQQIVANNNNTVSFGVTTAAKRPLSKASLFGSSQTPEQQKTPSFGSKQTQPTPPTYGLKPDSSKTMFGSTQPTKTPMFGQTTHQATTNAVTPSAPFQLSTTGPATMVQPSNTISAAPPAAAESKPAAAGFTFGASKPTPFGSNTTGKPSEPAPTGLPSF
uniref:Uncharacterized protein n=1 Tax=Ciona savignyi TaxID=51511 RepID=H2Z769_CIOSA